MKLSGNTILMTGGNAGIGRALAQALQARGNRVIVAGRRAEAIDAVVEADPGIAGLVLDVGNPGSIAAGAGRLAAEHRDLNVVIHNAGIMRAEDLTADPYDLTDAEETVATNLLGPIRLTAALLPQLRRNAPATIMTVSSGLGFVPLAFTPTYAATKAAIHSWSQSLRWQLKGQGIEVIELVPPRVATDLMPGQREDPTSMPLDAFIAEVMALLEADGAAPEVLVKQVRPFRIAERDGEYDAFYERLNTGHRLAGGR